MLLSTRRSYSYLLYFLLIIFALLLATEPTRAAHSRRRVTVVVRSAEDKYDRSITTFDKSKKDNTNLSRDIHAPGILGLLAVPFLLDIVSHHYSTVCVVVASLLFSFSRSIVTSGIWNDSRQSRVSHCGSLGEQQYQ